MIQRDIHNKGQVEFLFFNVTFIVNNYVTGLKNDEIESCFGLKTIF